jgi:Nif-specific ferredoxin III
MTDATTRDGRNWTPQYLLSIDPALCIGCGRCFKVCGRGVMTLHGLDESGNLLDLDDDDDDIERKVMALADGGACVGCGACSRVCPTNAQAHGPAG